MARIMIDGLQKNYSRTAPRNRWQESAFIPFNRETAVWRQEMRSKR
jgi:hypothetical protein